MELHHVHYFAALAEERNYTQAAQKCFISRQAMRQTVQALEQEFSVKLIENRKNRLYLTPAGELFAKKAQTLLAAKKDLELSLRDFIQKEHVVHLGISVSLLPLYAPEVMELLKNLRDPFPTLSLQRTVADADTLLEQLAEGTIDAAMVVEMGQNWPGLCRTELRTDELGILLSVDHPFAGKKSLSLSDFEGQTLVCMSQPERCFFPLWKAFADKGIHVRYRIILESATAFHEIRGGGLLGLDRLEPSEGDEIVLTKDLPLLDFPGKLSLSFFTREDAEPILELLGKYLHENAMH